MNSISDLLPESASFDGGMLALGGVRADELAREFGTPVVVYDAATLRGRIYDSIIDTRTRAVDSLLREQAQER